MNKRRFVKHRKESWRRFEAMVTQLDRISFARLRARDVSEFSRLFREISGDLATVRSRSWGRHLESYLNHLVSRGHNTFYSSPRGNLWQFLDFLAAGYPRLLRANLPYFLVAAALFFGPFAITWIVVQNDPATGSRVVDQAQLEAAAELYNHDPDDPQRPVFEETRASMGGFYVRNNTTIALRSFAGGIFLGVVTVYTLLFNGIAIGAIAGYIVAQGYGRAFTSFVISHGAFELTAIAVAGGAGLMLGNALLHPGQRTRLESLRVRGLESVQIAAGAAVMLAIAAAVEAFWSPSGVPSILKYIVGTLFWGLVLAYFALAGRGHEA